MSLKGLCECVSQSRVCETAQGLILAPCFLELTIGFERPLVNRGHLSVVVNLGESAFFVARLGLFRNFD
jgi:hypothetical protein